MSALCLLRSLHDATGDMTGKHAMRLFHSII